jgi:hypothetical protein
MLALLLPLFVPVFQVLWLLRARIGLPLSFNELSAIWML